jgi:hypothetical protein
MTLVVIFATMSFTLNMHYCGGTLVETALFHKAEGCGMEMSSMKENILTKKHCCDDEQLVVEGQDQLQFHADQISFGQQLFITAFVYTYSTLFEGLEDKVTSYETYKPPLVTSQIFKLDETYLI